MNTHRNKSLVRNVAIVMVLSIATLMGSTKFAAAAEDSVQTTVNGPFDTVVTKLKREITAHKLVIVKEVPFQMMLGMVGVNADPMIGFEIFHPRYGKVVYNEDVSAFKDVPLRILVRASSDKVLLEYRMPSAVFAPYSGLGELGQELDLVFADIVERVAQ